MWRINDATQSVQSLRILQQKRNRSCRLILKSQLKSRVFDKALDFFWYFNPSVTQSFYTLFLLFIIMFSKMRSAVQEVKACQKLQE